MSGGSSRPNLMFSYPGEVMVIRLCVSTPGRGEAVHGGKSHAKSTASRPVVRQVLSKLA